MEKAPRFEKKPEVIGNMEIQKRDLEIVNLVWRYRFMNSEQIQFLIEGSDQVILRRLQKLYHHGYLDRPLSQIVFSNPLIGPKKMVYGLSDKGADLLAERSGIDRGNVLWREKNRKVSERYIQHTLMISNFRACLTAALSKTNGAELRFWTRENTEGLQEKRYVYLKENGKQKKLPIVPDGFFVIEDAEGTMYFFLEADRSTMTNARFLNKMRAYWQWWRQGKSKEAGVEIFRVLTITKTEQRRENLRSITKYADERQAGSQMFWFASEESYELKHPEGILKDMWQTAKDDALHHILE